MKTITEFAAPTLNNATKTRDELIAAGKPQDELPQALGEALKLEGERLGHLLNALDAISTKKTDLKRVVVISLNEGEKAPAGAKQIGEHCFLAEYYPSLNPPGKQARPGNRDGKGRGKRGDKSRGRRDRRPRPKKQENARAGAEHGPRENEKT